MQTDVSVLIVDDSALMRNLIGKIVDSIPGLRVADKAMNGLFALQKIPLCNPDVIVLDLEMPQMNGVEFLKERKNRKIDIPVIVLSSIAREGAKVTMECLSLGASDFVTKPSGAESEDIHTVGKHLGELLLAYGGRYMQTKKGAVPSVRSAAPEKPSPSVSPFPAYERREERAPVKTVQSAPPLRKTCDVEIIAIGISTGGPNALREVCAKLEKDLPQPVIIVQHMPRGFTAEFAGSLDRICPLEVKEAAEGDILKPGRILIAPGDRHVEVERRPLAITVHLSDAPPQNGHRPSADVLFNSVAKQFQNHAIGVIMTGMGKDGAAALGAMRREGALTLGQDEASCVVYGMPRAAFEMGAVCEQVSLDSMAAVLCKYAKELAPRGR